MPEKHHRVPGWHLDPHDPTLVRHWDGGRWQSRRSRPMWTVTASDFVVDARARSDPAGPLARPSLGEVGRPDVQRATTPSLGPGLPGTPTQGRRSASASGTGSADRTRRCRPHHETPQRPVPPAPWAATRGPLLLVGLIVAIALAAMVTAVGGSNVRTMATAPIPSGFVARASQLCATQLGSSRPSTLPVDAASVAAEARQVAEVTATLQQLAASTGALPEVNDWVQTWQRYADDEQARADLLKSPPTSETTTVTASSPVPAPSGEAGGAVATTAAPRAATASDEAPALATRSRRQADAADRFAVLNDLQTCTILTRQPASVLSIPS